MKKNRIVWYIILVIAIIAFVTGFVYLIIYYYDEVISKSEYEDLEDRVIATYNAQQANTTPDDTLPGGVITKEENPINFDELSKVNSDLYAWIKIPDTQVNYPIAQSEDEENYYLTHNIYKNEKFAAAIYSQFYNKKDFSDKVTVLYGHNMLNGSMFGDLHKFENQTFFNENKYIYVYTKGHILKYLIFSAHDYNDDHILKTFDFDDDEVFSDYLKISQDPKTTPSIVRPEVNLSTDDKILILSTCSNRDNNKRYLVQGVLIDDQITK